MKKSEPGWPKEIKKTRQRGLVYQVLEAAATPVTATEVLTALEQAGTPVWLSTIYRVLDTFTEHGMVHKTEGMDGGMAMYELSRRGHKHYAVCMECRKITPLETCPFEREAPLLPRGEEDFQVTGHRLQVFGVCGSCRRGRECARSSEGEEPAADQGGAGADKAARRP